LNTALSTSWPGLSLASAIHVFPAKLQKKKDVDARHKAGHDESKVLRIGVSRNGGASSPARGRAR
jgi:hypothetical protein